MKPIRYTALAALIAFSAGCSTRFDHMMRPPTMTAPGDMRNPMPPPTAERMRVPQYPAYEEANVTAGSLWRSGPESLFGDRRARTAGDIVTVMIEIDEEAEIRNRTNRSKNATDDIDVGAMFGLNTLAARVLPNGSDLNPAVQASSSATSGGDGLIQREERITLKIAATVTSVLPNGHLAISGSQEIRVNYELRELQLAGIIRREDISRDNIVTSDKIADARISYGGRGQISDLQKARYGQQLIDLVSPF